MYGLFGAKKMGALLWQFVLGAYRNVGLHVHTKEASPERRLRKNFCQRLCSVTALAGLGCGPRAHDK
jgi:hypothetical protein